MKAIDKLIAQLMSLEKERKAIIEEQIEVEEEICKLSKILPGDRVTVNHWGAKNIGVVDQIGYTIKEGFTYWVRPYRKDWVGPMRNRNLIHIIPKRDFHTIQKVL